MKSIHENLISMVKAHHRDIIKEADENPDKWYELYIVTDGCSETVESGDTFDELAHHFDKYAIENISIDIWENRESPNNLAVDLIAAKNLVVKSEMYAHKIEIVFDSVRITNLVAYNISNNIPDNVWCAIGDGLANMDISGAFDVGEYMSQDDNKQIRYTGSWKINQGIEYNFLARMVLWFNNFGENEGLSKELFYEVYGSVMGEHYFVKWNSVYERNILKMIGYFGLKSGDGAKFYEMIKIQMAKYEKRIKRDEK